MKKGGTGFRLTLSRELYHVTYTHCLTVVDVFPHALAEAFVVEVLEVRHYSLSSMSLSLPPEIVRTMESKVVVGDLGAFREEEHQ